MKVASTWRWVVLSFVLLCGPLAAQASSESRCDVFGRAIQTLDPTGSGTAAYDDLNRPTTVTPAAGQGATFQALKDTVLKRHISRMTVTGAGTWEWRGDGKGRTAAVLNPFNQLTSWKFDKDGKTLRETRSNGTWTDSAYNGRDWLTQIAHRFADGSLIDHLQSVPVRYHPPPRLTRYPR